MFDKFRKLFTTENLLDAAFETTITMLEFDHRMFEASRQSLRNSDSAELPFDIKKTDREINRYERDVRRKVLTHLALSGAQDLTPGLALVTIVIDVERIGDFTKNIYDLARQHPLRLPGDRFEPDLRSVEKTVDVNFEKTITVLKDQDVELGREVMRAEDATSKLVDGIVVAILTSDDLKLQTRDAVSLALYSRFLKRINCHLTNISSSIVNPFPRIGFREKMKRNPSNKP